MTSGLNSIPDVDFSDEEADEISSMPTNTGRGPGGLPRTVPLSPSPVKIKAHTTGEPAGAKSVDWTPGVKYSATMGRSSSATTTSGQTLPPLMSTSTGTRYGMALAGGGNSNGGAARMWVGVGTPTCPRCGQAVYFAEQVRGDFSMSVPF